MQSPSPLQFAFDSEPIPCPIASQSPASNHSNMATDRLIAEIELAYERDEGVGASGDSRKPTIAYEEAIERELEYQKRKKLPSSFLTTPSRELAPNPPLTGGKRKEISGTQYTQAQRHLSPNQQRQQHNTQGQQHTTQFQKTLFWCNICQVHCASSNSLKTHRYGRMHREKFEEIHRGKTNNNTKMLWCEECNIPCMNEMALTQHRAGKKHIARIEALRAHNSAPGARMNKICNG